MPRSGLRKESRNRAGLSPLAGHSRSPFYDLLCGRIDSILKVKYIAANSGIIEGMQRCRVENVQQATSRECRVFCAHFGTP